MRGTGLSTFPELANLSLKSLSGPCAVPILHNVEIEAKGTVACLREHSVNMKQGQADLLRQTPVITTTQPRALLTGGQPLPALSGLRARASTRLALWPSVLASKENLLPLKVTYSSLQLEPCSPKPPPTFPGACVSPTSSPLDSPAHAAPVTAQPHKETQ